MEKITFEQAKKLDTMGFQVFAELKPEAVDGYIDYGLAPESIREFEKRAVRFMRDNARMVPLYFDVEEIGRLTVVAVLEDHYNWYVTVPLMGVDPAAEGAFNALAKAMGWKVVKVSR